MTQTKIILIRHAQSAPDKGIAEDLWPLSQRGEEQALEVRDKLATVPIDFIFSSPLIRAMRTVAPLAQSLGVTIQTIPELRERKLSGEMIENWLDELKLTWQDFDYRLSGGESSSQCQQRVCAAVESACNKHSGSTLVFSTHGNALALFLNNFDSSFGFDQWRELKNPDYFYFIHDSKSGFARISETEFITQFS